MNSFSDAFEQPILEVGKKGYLRLLNELVPYVHFRSNNMYLSNRLGSSNFSQFLGTFSTQIKGSKMSLNYIIDKSAGPNIINLLEILD